MAATRLEQATAGRVLIVDDLEDMCWVLDKLLSERGHLVRTALTAVGALRALADFDCQVVVADYRLPDSNGLDVIARLTACAPRLRSILMTSYGAGALRDQARDNKLFAYLDKPFNNDCMIETVELGIRAWGSSAEAAAARPPTLFPGRAPQTAS